MVIYKQERISKLMEMEKALIKNVKEYLEAKIDDEMVLMHIESAKYVGLDKIATHIWELLSVPMSTDALVQQLTKKYDVDSDQCLQDVVVLIEDMKEKRLLVPED